MKLTKSKLQQIIKEEVQLLQEEAADCLRDYRLGGMTEEEYKNCLRRFGALEEPRRRRYSPRKTSYVGAESNVEQIEAVKGALQAKPSKFLDSVLRQLEQGRGLSEPQKKIVRKIIPGSGELF